MSDLLSNSTILSKFNSIFVHQMIQHFEKLTCSSQYLLLLMQLAEVLIPIYARQIVKGSTVEVTDQEMAAPDWSPIYHLHLRQSWFKPCLGSDSFLLHLKDCLSETYMLLLAEVWVHEHRWPKEMPPDLISAQPCDLVSLKSSPIFSKSCPRSILLWPVFNLNVMLLKQPQKLLNIWATFQRKIVIQNI